MQHWGDNFIPVIPMDCVIHTPDNPFCRDRTCPCHENDEEAIKKVYQAYQGGLITAQDATDIIMGRKEW